MAYCTQADVARYININQVPDIDSVIAAAQDKVEKYTDDIFETRALTVYTETNRANTAPLPYRTQSVAEVVILPRETVLNPTSWVFEGGDFPRVRVYATTPFNLLTAGQEPWVITKLPKMRLKVSGVFGYEQTPFQIVEGTALLAAYYISQAGLGELKEKALQIIGAPADITSISVEGYSVNYRTLEQSELKNSTGIIQLDRFLSPWKRPKRLQVG
jgi:hypothetical protein